MRRDVFIGTEDLILCSRQARRTTASGLRGPTGKWRNFPPEVRDKRAGWRWAKIIAMGGASGTVGMDGVGRTLRSLLKMTLVELKLFAREPITVVFTFAYPFIVLFVLAGVFGNTPDPEGQVFRGVGAMDYYVPAYIGIVIAAVGLIGVPVHLAGYRERGVMRRFRASSVSSPYVLGSQAMVGLITVAVGALLLAGVALPVYDIRSPDSVGGVMAAVLLGTLSFVSLGLLLGALLPTVRAAQGAGLLLFFAMFLVSGAGPPPEVMSKGMRRLGEWLPLSHIIALIQDSWLGFGWNLTQMFIVMAILVVSLFLSLRLFRWE